ncbi:hypothetical protein [Chryseobacterium sp. StRB126]|uniref:hypothetical protein n=1 Tax=Chryseobacterium sp. StRB126 TaxID=878220 RepID=UPI000A8ABFB5|nr:hypothetical protein [Chryseobacterium sp. StRB126]
MKKTISSILLLYFSFYYSQVVGDNGQSHVTNMIPLPTTANAYSLNKVEKLPMDYFRGKANINIPIYTISVNGINIPIALSYNTGGIRLGEVASTVGLGWGLFIPNSISKAIMGKDDDNYPVRFKSFAESQNYLNSYIDYGTGDAREETIEQLYEGNTYDTMPDIFNYNLPTVSGGFILNNNVGYTIPQDNTKIQKTGTNTFTLTDDKGNTFWISGKNSVNGGIPGEMNYVNSYAIDSLKTAEGKTVEFVYAKNQSYMENSIRENAYIPLLIMADSSTSMLSKYDIIRGKTDYSEKLISKIIFPEGEVIFEYSDNPLYPIENNAYRKDIGTTIGTTTLKNGIALRNIKVYNKASVLIKDYTFNYSYFNPQTPSDIPQDYRLKLDNVYDNVQNTYHRFSYNETSYFPRRSTNNDDYWGYINNIINTDDDHNFPKETFNDAVPKYIGGRDRKVNTNFSQLGMLTRITYPTGGYKNLYYENNTALTTQYDFQIQRDHYEELDNVYKPGVYGDNSSEKLFSIPSSVFSNMSNPKFEFSFTNWCDNNNDNVGTIHPTSCIGAVKIGDRTFTSNGKQFVKTVDASTSPIKLSLYRVDECGCGLSVDILSEIRTEATQITNIGGLRIKKIEDFDGNGIQNVFQYKYENAVINQPFVFMKKIYREIPSSNPSFAPSYDPFMKISNSSSASSSYFSSDIVSYSKVTEYNDNGETVYNFSQSNSNVSLTETKFYNYDHWKGGLLLSKSYKKNNDTLREETNEYIFNPLKNPLSGYLPHTNDEIAFAFVLNVLKTKVQRGPVGNFIDAFGIDENYIKIESAKVEHVATTTKEFFGNKSVVTKVLNNYWDTDINKPFNVRSTENILPSGESVKTEYQYAHQTGNQLLIDKNMIATPLETETKQTVNGTTNILSKSKTVFPTALPTPQTGDLVLPMSVLSYDLQNPATVANEVKYDKYDPKGNIQQYTTKDGVSTVIIWGYNGTQPIAKIENAKLEGIGQSFIDSIVNASNTDAAAESNNDETNLLNAFKTFRDNLSGYQITTYSYDPLIGVRSITPPSGIREVYLYDTAGRLKEVREHNNTGKLLKEFNYHYKN